MKDLFKFCLFTVLCLFGHLAAVYPQGNLPRLKEALFIETYSPAEVTIRAKGLGADVDQAEMDAKKSAVYFVLTGTSDPVLQTQEEKNAFGLIQDAFFSNDNINSFVTYMATGMLSNIKTADGRKVEKLMRVNKSKIIEQLVEKNIVASRQQLAETVGNPFIMVLPEVKKGQNPIELLQNDPNIKKGAEVIESHLTAKQYDVQVPEQTESLNNLVSAQSGLKGVEDDISYQLALSIGADVYITYNVQIESGTYGKKAVVGCRAYETTTAKLLGTETGYSPERPSVAEAAIIEEAMNDAIDRVLSRINAYWKQDAAIGRQFKVIFKITGSFSAPEDVSDAIDDIVKEMSVKSKQNAMSDKTLDYIVWQKDLESPKDIFRELKKRVESNSTLKSEGVTVKRLNVNRKLLVLSVENGG